MLTLQDGARNWLGIWTFMGFQQKRVRAIQKRSSVAETPVFFIVQVVTLLKGHASHFRILTKHGVWPKIDDSDRAVSASVPGSIQRSR